MLREAVDRWNHIDSSELYGVARWGKGYFSVGENGHLQVHPNRNPGRSIDMKQLVDRLELRGIDAPILLRFNGILCDRVQELHDAFAQAMQDHNYQGDYRCVYPVKVNPQRQVVEKVLEYGRPFGFGLEAGSKPELIAAISMLKNRDACLICNGYKDEEFIDLGLFAIKMGYRIFFVIEVPGEVDLIIERAKHHRVIPAIGLRIKLSTQASGQWNRSGGDSSVFGLSMNHIINVIDRLKQEDMLDCLQLLHYHIGSQIPNISDIRAGVMEACRLYEELVREGAPMGYLDLGGGLAVDYDGSNSDSHSSRNYSLEEYCSAVVA